MLGHDQSCYKWTVHIVWLWYWYLYLIQHSNCIIMEPENTSTKEGMYQTADGRYDWCLFCHKEDIVRGINIQEQCRTQTKAPDNWIFSSDNISTVQWCFGSSRGKPPTCPKLVFPNHTHWEVSDPAHPLYTHTYLTVRCKEGYRRESPTEPQQIRMRCSPRQRRWVPSFPENFSCMPKRRMDRLEILKEHATLNVSSPLMKSSSPGDKADVNYGLILGIGIPVFISLVFISILLVVWRYRKNHPKKSSSKDKIVTKFYEEKTPSESEESEKDDLLTEKQPTESRPCRLAGDGCSSSSPEKQSQNTIPKEVVRSRILPQQSSVPSSGANICEIDMEQSVPPNKNILSERVDIVGFPNQCSCLLEDIETYEGGALFKNLIERLDPDSMYKDSWVNLAFEQGYGMVNINFIKSKKSNDMFFGPTAHVLQEMMHKLKRMGHLVKFLHKARLYSFVQNILSHHIDCPYCNQFAQQH